MQHSSFEFVSSSLFFVEEFHSLPTSCIALFGACAHGRFSEFWEHSFQWEQRILNGLKFLSEFLSLWVHVLDNLAVFLSMEVRCRSYWWQATDIGNLVIRGCSRFTIHNKRHGMRFSLLHCVLYHTPCICPRSFSPWLTRRSALSSKLAAQQSPQSSHPQQSHYRIGHKTGAFKSSIVEQSG